MAIEPRRQELRDLLRLRPSVKTIRTSEVGECGLACIAMIGSYFGLDTDLYHLRKSFPLSARGMRLTLMRSVLEDLGLDSRAVRASATELRQVALPAVLHWNQNHFVVLVGMRGARAEIIDPSEGRRTVSRAELAEHYSGVALEVWPTATFEPRKERIALGVGSLVKQLRGIRGSTARVLAISFALLVAGFLIPLIFQLVIDRAILRERPSLLLGLVSVLVAISLTQVALETLRAWTLQALGAVVSFQFVGNLVRHLFSLAPSFFVRRDLADILSRVASLNVVQDSLTRGAVAAIIDGAMALIAVVILLNYSWVMAAVVMGGVLLNSAISWMTFPINRRLTEGKIVTQAQAQSHLMESIRAVITIKIFGREAERRDRWRTLFSRQINHDLRLGYVQALVTAGQGTVSALQLAGVLFLGAQAIIKGDGFTVGMLYAFLSFRQIFNDRATSFLLQLTQFRLLGLHFERIADIALQPPESRTLHGDQLLDTGSVELRNVSFRYGIGEPLVLHKVDLAIADGDFLAIVGRSGAGKSTLVRLLLGILDPTDGEILLANQPLTQIKGNLSRSALIGAVMQDDRLLSGSIADNIAFFDPQIDMAKVEEVARLTRIHDDIERMPMRYHSLIGDMGAALSGGQQQRILLARALYRNPKILLLDEGTANLDPATEQEIVELIATLPLTRIVVAHRPALVMRADRVLELANGSLASLDAATYAAPIG